MRLGIPTFLLASFLACATASAQPASPPNQAGVIVVTSGDARVTPKGGTPRPIKAGDVVSEGDLIVSPKDGEVHVKMQDSGFLAIRPGTRVEIVTYVADGGDSDKAILNLIAGGIRSITGWIGKYNARGYQLKTTTATIGVRGTDHETRVIPEGSSEGEAGTYDRVYVGETVMETAAGQTTVTANRAGFQPARARGRARLLASIPAFYRPGPNEAEIAKQHAQIQGQIAARREERRKAVLEKRAALQDSRAKTVDMLRENRGLLDDMKAAQALHEDIQQKRKALEDDAKAGRGTRKELNERRQALVAQEKQLASLHESIKQRRKALGEQVGDTKEKRKALEEEKASAKEEIKSLQRRRTSATARSSRPTGRPWTRRRNDGARGGPPATALGRDRPPHRRHVHDRPGCAGPRRLPGPPRGRGDSSRASRRAGSARAAPP